MDELDLTNNPLPVCPHCGYEDKEWWDGSTYEYDGDTSNVVCPSCSKDYHCEVNIETTFNTKKLEGEIDE